MSHERAQALLREAGGALSRCQKDFNAGRAVSVDPMEKIVYEFCGILQRLPRAEASAYQEPLKVMLEGLQALEVLLARKRDDLRAEISALNQGQKAQTAYRQSGYKGEE